MNKTRQRYVERLAKEVRVYKAGGTKKTQLSGGVTVAVKKSKDIIAAQQADQKADDDL